jgi:hypothetical protein
VITGIATQGYGDPSKKEWVTEFMLMYSVDGKDFKPLKTFDKDVAVRLV